MIHDKVFIAILIFMYNKLCIILTKLLLSTMLNKTQSIEKIFSIFMHTQDYSMLIKLVFKALKYSNEYKLKCKQLGSIAMHQLSSHNCTIFSWTVSAYF